MAIDEDLARQYMDAPSTLSNIASTLARASRDLSQAIGDIEEELSSLPEEYEAGLKNASFELEEEALYIVSSWADRLNEYADEASEKQREYMFDA